jgi:hypothetical protein
MLNVRLLVVALSVFGFSGCITRPGMNSDCRWPPEPASTLNLARPDDDRHLVIDAELVAELTDRYRFHPAEEQQACGARLTQTVARTHDVSVAEVERARARIAARGLDLAVNVPVTLLFVYVVVFAIRAIQRRFLGEPLPAAIALVVGSVLLGGLFVMVGEFWTSILQMIRVSSLHVGGRVRELPWFQHERQILLIAVGSFWVIALWRAARNRRPGHHAAGTPGART